MVILKNSFSVKIKLSCRDFLHKNSKWLKIQYGGFKKKEFLEAQLLNEFFFF
jgi:hypothetical protein